MLGQLLRQLGGTYLCPVERTYGKHYVSVQCLYFVIFVQKKVKTTYFEVQLLSGKLRCVDNGKRRHTSPDHFRSKNLCPESKKIIQLTLSVSFYSSCLLALQRVIFHTTILMSNLRIYCFIFCIFLGNF